MSQSLNVISSSGSNSRALASDAASYRPALSNFPAFPGLNTFSQSLNAQSQTDLSVSTQQALPHSQPPSSSSGNSDIEKLERLKKEILEGQNPIYKAVPQPSFLETLYLGRSVQAQNSAPAHPDQIDTHTSPSTDHQTGSVTPSKLGAESCESDRRVVESHDSGDQNTDDKEANGETNSNPHKEFTPTPAPDTGKSIQTDSQQSYVSGMSEQDATKVSSSEPGETATHEHQSPGQPATSSGSENMTVYTFSGGFDVPRGPLRDATLANDPPYDPKESLSHLKNGAIWLDERSRHSSGPYTSSASDPCYAHPLDSARDGEWNSHSHFHYDERSYVVDNHRDKYPITTSTVDHNDYHFNYLKEFNGRQPKEDLANLDIRRLASSLSESVFRSPDKDVARDADSSGPAMHSSTTKPANGADRHVPFEPSAASAIPQPATDSQTTRSVAPTVFTPVDEKRPLDESIGIQQTSSKKQQASTVDGLDVPSQTLRNIKRTLEERITDPSSSGLVQRDDVRMPLEERITSPPIDRSMAPLPMFQERRESHPLLEERISSRSAFADSRGAASQEPPCLPDSKSIPTPLSLAGSRLTTEKIVPVPPVSASAVSQVLQTKTEDQPSFTSLTDTFQRNELFHSAQRSEPHSPVRGKPLGDQRGIRTPPPYDSPDAMLIPSAAYRGDRERHLTERDRPYVEIGHYERPLPRERDAAVEDRARPGFESREWRERGSYSRDFVQRSDAYHPSGVLPRAWTGKARNGGPSEPPFDNKDRYYDREYDRRPSLPPRSWNREDASRIRPPPEVYPPTDSTDRDRYPSAGLRERPRIRGRSPSPSLVSMRRSSYGRPPMPDTRPAKRVRDEMYYDGRDRRYSDFYDRPMSPPPDYYGPPEPYRARDMHGDAYHDRAQSSEGAYYERRTPDMGPSPSPPYSGRAAYFGPDMDRYGGLPPRTA